jgi:hypothetical protein
MKLISTFVLALLLSFPGGGFAAQLLKKPTLLQEWLPHRNVVLPFQPVGKLGKNLQFMGIYYAKAFFYYEPNINVETGRGQVVVENTNDSGDHKPLGLFITFLDGEGQAIGNLLAVDSIDQPGNAHVMLVSETPEYWSTVKQVKLEPFVGSQLLYGRTEITICKYDFDLHKTVCDPY